MTFKKIIAAFLVVCITAVCLTACKPDVEESDTSTNHDNQVTVRQTAAPVTAPQDGGEETTKTSDQNSPTDVTPQTTVITTQRQQVKVTLQEGWSFMQVAQALEQAGVCSAADFYNTCENYTVKSFTIPSSPDRCFKMEGYLFPDTYDFYTNDDTQDVVRKILNNYASKSGMPSDDTLILASIIEKEARSDENMKLVSSVYHNRLQQGMKLQADPTREYVNDYITGNSLVSNQSKYAALYNTEKCPALPAGPVCSPSARAIAAAKNYPDTEYLFFFFGQDNQNHYSKTNAEHEQQIVQYGIG